MESRLLILAAWLFEIGVFSELGGGGKDVGNFVRKKLPLPAEMEKYRERLATLVTAGDTNDAIGRTLALARNIAAPLERDSCRQPLFYPLLAVSSDAQSSTRHEDCSYRQLYDEFCAAIQKIPLDLGFSIYLNSLVSCYECYGSHIPAGKGISIRDLSAVTAAIAQAIWAKGEVGSGFMLFGAEFSGVQEFIFAGNCQADENFSKLLCARSLILQALTRAAWLELLNNLGFTHAACIMDTPGKFLLLLPDTEKARKAVDNVVNEVQDWLLNNFHGIMYMNSARLFLDADSLRTKNFCSTLGKFQDALERSKLHPLIRQFHNGLSPVLPTSHQDYEKYGECGFCHAAPACGRLDDKPCCPLCKQLLEKIGATLPNAKYAVFSRKPGDFLLFGNINIALLENTPDAKILEEAMNIEAMGNNGSFSVAAYGIHVPVFASADKEFAKPVGMSSMGTLGACKVQLDSTVLLPEANFSIARLAAMSRILKFFFGFHLIRITEGDYPKVCIIPCGINGIFTFGPYDEILSFTRRMYQNFASFIGDDCTFALSAGIAAINPQLPLQALVEKADSSLAKSLDTMPHNNLITAFDVTVSSQEFNQLLKTGIMLEDLCNQGKLEPAFLRRMLGYARKCGQFAFEGEISNGDYLLHIMREIHKYSSIANEESEYFLRAAQDIKSFSKMAISFSWTSSRTRKT